MPHVYVLDVIDATKFSVLPKDVIFDDLKQKKKLQKVAWTFVHYSQKQKLKPAH